MDDVLLILESDRWEDLPLEETMLRLGILCEKCASGDIRVREREGC